MNLLWNKVSWSNIPKHFVQSKHDNEDDAHDQLSATALLRKAVDLTIYSTNIASRLLLRSSSFAAIPIV